MEHIDHLARADKLDERIKLLAKKARTARKKAEQDAKEKHQVFLMKVGQGLIDHVGILPEQHRERVLGWLLLSEPDQAKFRALLPPLPVSPDADSQS